MLAWAFISLVEMRIGTALREQGVRVVGASWGCFVLLLVAEGVAAFLHIITYL